LFKGVQVVQDNDQYSTDLMKSIQSLQEKEKRDGVDVRRTVSLYTHESWPTGILNPPPLSPLLLIAFFIF
jgi:hypothetical protein